MTVDRDVLIERVGKLPGRSFSSSSLESTWSWGVAEGADLVLGLGLWPVLTALVVALGSVRDDPLMVGGRRPGNDRDPPAVPPMILPGSKTRPLEYRQN